MKKGQLIIGGEFEISPLLFQQEGKLEEDGMFYSSGRAALYHILCALYAENDGRVIFLPDYLCESIVEVVQLTNLKIFYYPVFENLKPDLSFLLSHNLSGSIVLFINYFGGIDLEEDIINLKKNDSTTFIIEDNVQSLYLMYRRTKADAVFTSFRKTLPVPDGGWVKTNSLVLEKANEQNIFADYKIMGGMLKQHRQFYKISDESYLRLFEKGEQLINTNLKSGISEFTPRILSNLDLQEIAAVRKRNAYYLTERLKEIEIFPLVEFEDTMVPLFVPIVVQDRNELRHLLFSENIYCPCHWPCSNKELKRGREMAEYELSLIIDQRYNLADMDRIIAVLKKYYGRVHH